METYNNNADCEHTDGHVKNICNDLLQDYRT